MQSNIKSIVNMIIVKHFNKIEVMLKEYRTKVNRIGLLLSVNNIRCFEKPSEIKRKKYESAKYRTRTANS